MTEENRTEKKVLLEAKHLTKCYGDLLVLDDISEEIREGEIVAVIGPSGGGKSTFLRCLNVLEDPTAGQIVFDGEDLTDLKIDINVCRQKMGMVFQQFNLFNNLTVLKNITLAPIIVNKGKLRNAKIHNFFMPFYNRYLEKNKSKIYAKIDKKLAKQKKIIEDTRVLLAPVEKEWESTKKVVENAGKKLATYDSSLTKKKIKLVTKIENAERVIDRTTYPQPKTEIIPQYKTVAEIKKSGGRQRNETACENRTCGKSERLSVHVKRRTKTAYRYRKSACYEPQSNAFRRTDECARPRNGRGSS